MTIPAAAHRGWRLMTSATPARTARPVRMSLWAPFTATAIRTGLRPTKAIAAGSPLVCRSTIRTHSKKLRAASSWKNSRPFRNEPLATAIPAADRPVNNGP